MTSRHLQQNRPFRAHPTDIERQEEAAGSLGLNWSQFARGTLDMFASLTAIRVTKEAVRRHAMVRKAQGRVGLKVPYMDVEALLILGQGPPYFLQRRKDTFEPVQSLTESFKHWNLSADDFEDPALVRAHLGT